MKLAEFRKAKVRLDISHQEIESGVMKLTFRAVDFLDQTVPASDLRIEAVVRRKVDSDPRLWGLNPKQFAEWKNHDGHFYTLSTEQRALTLSGEAVVSGSAAATHPSRCFRCPRHWR